MLGVRRSGNFHIGTSGWNYPHWRGLFYPQGLPAGKWFARYAQVFRTVEINNTFYHLPREETFNAWRRQAPENFIYAVKANRFITHMKKLKDPASTLEKFLPRAKRLEEHLGPILYQLPPGWRPNLERLRRFCEQLPANLTHVMEFRQPAWLGEETFRILEEHEVCLCIHDMFPHHPRRVIGKALYVRFHGVGARYGGSYSRRDLRPWAAWMRETAASGCEVYAYFNNDRNGYAIRNAQTLRELLGVADQMEMACAA